MTKIEALEREFNDLISYIRQASNAPENGLKIDSVMLQNKVEELSGKAENSDPKTAARLRPLMSTLIEELDVLAGRLENFTRKNR